MAIFQAYFLIQVGANNIIYTIVYNLGQSVFFKPKAKLPEPCDTVYLCNFHKKEHLFS